MLNEEFTPQLREESRGSEIYIWLHQNRTETVEKSCLKELVQLAENSFLSETEKTISFPQFPSVFPFPFSMRSTIELI